MGNIINTMKICPICKKEFIQNSNSQIFCFQKCYKKSKKTKHCECGKIICNKSKCCNVCSMKKKIKLKIIKLKGVNNSKYNLECHKKHYCIEKCGREISYSNWCYGKKRCRFCAFDGKRNVMYGVRNFGKKSGAWRGGITSLHFMIRELKEYKEWRKQVFERDNYTCQECKQYGGDLEAHHKKKFSIIFQEFLQIYNQFSPIEDKESLVRFAINYKLFWDVSNGQTLCKGCHNKTKKGKTNIRGVLK